MGVVIAIVSLSCAVLGDRVAIAAESLALRRQLGVLQHTASYPRLRRRDRLSWVWLSRLWSDRRSSLMMVEPATVTRAPRDATG
jgi:hypothetical protein